MKNGIIIKQIGKLLSWLLHKLTQLKFYLTDKSKILESEYFDDLTPHDEMSKKEGGKYFTALEWALANDKVRNIAVTGTYGSGKSSILRSFEKLHKEHKYLNISLASFSRTNNKVKDDDKDETNNNTRVTTDKKGNRVNVSRLIERSILQQIFYRVKPNKIPDSRFKKIYFIGRWKVLLFSILITFWLLSIAIFLQLDTITSITFWKQVDVSWKEFLINSSAAISIIGFIVFLFYLSKIFKNLRFSKLNIAKGEIELSNNLDSSILNDHLDEILYFFEVTDYDVVVIEDIDRYDVVDILVV